MGFRRSRWIKHVGNLHSRSKAKQRGSTIGRALTVFRRALLLVPVGFLIPDFDELPMGRNIQSRRWSVCPLALESV